MQSDDDLRRHQRQWLMELIEETGLSGNKLAQMSDVAPSTINRFLHNTEVKHVLSARTVKKIADSQRVPLPLNGGVGATGARLQRVTVPERGAPTMPIRGTSHAAGGQDGYIQLNADPIEWVARPRGLEGVKEAYGTYIIGESMEPKFEHGQLVYVHPGRPYRKGHFVVVEFHDGRGLVKQFLRQDNHQLVLRQFNPRRDLRYPLAEVKHVHKIYSADEL